MIDKQLRHELCRVAREIWERHPSNCRKSYGPFAKKDFDDATGLLRANDGKFPAERDLRERMDRYLLSTDKSCVKENYSLALFFRRWRQYAPPRRPTPRLHMRFGQEQALGEPYETKPPARPEVVHKLVQEAKKQCLIAGSGRRWDRSASNSGQNNF